MKTDVNLDEMSLGDALEHLRLKRLSAAESLAEWVSACEKHGQVSIKDKTTLAALKRFRERSEAYFTYAKARKCKHKQDVYQTNTN